MNTSTFEIKEEIIIDEEATTSIKAVKNEPLDDEFMSFPWEISMDDSQEDDASSQSSFDEFDHRIPIVELKTPPDVPSNIEKNNDFYLLSNQWFGRKVCAANIILCCPMCSMEFSNSRTWRKHLGDVHQLLNLDRLNLEYINTNLAKCKECGETIRTNQFMPFLTHAITHMPNKNYFKCKLCNWSTSVSHTLKCHLQKQHVDIMAEAKKNADSKQCPYCQQQFITINKMRSHMRYVHKNQIDDKVIFICPYCDAKFPKNYAFRKHLKTKHLPNSVEEHNFEKIEETDGVNIYNCKLCTTTMRGSNRILHKVQAHGFIHEKKHCYKCKYCEKMFLGLTLMRNHSCAKLREALLLKPVSKEYLPEVTPAIKRKKKCDKGAKRLLMSNLRYVCPICGHEFPTEQKCARHRKALHNLDETTFPNLMTSERKTPYKPFRCKICKKYYNVKEQWLEHECGMPEKNPQISKLLLSSLISCVCNVCNEEFESMQTWQQHLDDIHKFNDLTALRMKREKGSILKCLECSQKLHDTASTRRTHRLVHLPFLKQFKCTQCQQILSTEEDVYSHVVQCNGSQMLFDEFEEIDEEENSSTNITEEFLDDLYKRGVSSTVVEKYIKIICPLCNDMEFSTNNMLMAHLRDVHDSCRDYFTKHKNGSTTITVCNYCKREFCDFNNSNLIKHQLIHLRSCFLCKHCDVKLTAFTRITNHVVNIHMPAIVESTTENKNAHEDPLHVTPNEVYRTSRLRMCVRREQASVFNKYNEYFLFACPECNEPFDTQELWHLHINSSHDFLDANHINIEITADGARQCTECKLQINGGRLHEQRHKFTHMPYRAFICKLCQHRSNTTGVMIQHMRRRHFTLGSYKCPLCTEVLGMNVELHAHVRKEHVNAEFPETTCQICLFNASKKSALVVHMDIHNPNRVLFTCNECNRTYCSPKDLSRHKIKSHSNELQNTSDTCENTSTTITETNCDVDVEDTEIDPISVIKVEEPDYDEYLDESI